MKRLNTLFIIALAIGVSVLAAAYADGESHPAMQPDYIWYDQLQELNEMCRAKHRLSARYGECARHARAEHRNDAAALFMAMSRAEAIHCDNCRRAIAALGGRFSEPVTEATPRRTAGENMRRALHDEDSLRRRGAGSRIRHDMHGLNRNIARMLAWCDASDIHQIMILRRKIETTGADGRTTPCDTATRAYGGRTHDPAGSAAGHRASTALYAVCPTCGDVTEWGLHADRCPHCMTDCRLFILY